MGSKPKKEPVKKTATPKKGGVAKSRKQGQLKGFEQEEIPELTDASEIYHNTVRERLELQKAEADQKAHLEMVMKQCMEDKLININPNAKPGEVEASYRYLNDSNEPRIVEAFKEKKAVIKVRSEKPNEDD